MIKLVLCDMQFKLVVTCDSEIGIVLENTVQMTASLHTGVVKEPKYL